MNDRRDTLAPLLREQIGRALLTSGDTLLGIVAGGAAIYLALHHPETLRGLVAPVAQIVGSIVALTIAGLAVQTAFMDQSFLRKVEAIGREPIRYVQPLIVTAALGIFAIMSVIVLAALPPGAPTWLLATVGASTGLFTFWMLGNLLHNLSTLIQFVGLQGDAARIPDDLPILKPSRHDRADDADSARDDG